MDEDEKEKEEVASEGSFKDDPYLVNNLMHNLPMYEGEATPGLDALVEVVILGKKTNHLCYFVI